VLRIVTLGILPSYLARLLYRTTLAGNRERLAIGLSLGSSVVSLCLNILLIPRYGIIGASIAAATLQVYGLAQSVVVVSLKVTPIDLKSSLLRPGLCVLASILTYVALLSWSAVLAWMAALLVFAGLLLLTRVITKEDLSELRGRTPRSRL
jgi:O-antigen/teichoic acid export membrane protein